jgi:hypothetical protein
LFFSSCASSIDTGAPSAERLIMNYFDTFNAKDAEALKLLFPSSELIWDVSPDPDRSDVKRDSVISLNKSLIKNMVKSFKAEIAEQGEFPSSITDLVVSPPEESQINWSRETVGSIPQIQISLQRDGKQYRGRVDQIVKYRGKYYLTRLPEIDWKRWE